jgi:osmotically-inducible protein OsmY
VALALGVGLMYLISRQGWAVTARQVHGVAEAVKATSVAVRDTSADAATTAKAKAALALSKRISGSEVNVDTTNAVATLTGRVPTPEAREVAGQIVADTSSVQDVRNLLVVDPSMRPEQERERLVRRVNDLETQTALSEALQDRPELNGAKVRVRVADGGVTLDGTVASEAQKALAEQLARTFPGVQRLNNRLK